MNYKTQEEIGNVVGLKQDNISIKIKQIEQFLEDLWKNPDMEIPIKYQFLAEKWQKILGFKDHTPVNTKLKEMNQIIDNLWQNPELEINTKYEFLREKIKEMCLFQPQLYNIWNQQSYDSDNTHFGKFPFTFMEILIYYYTEPFDVVYDPFAGGGTTIDVCKKWMRKYFAADLNPIETRNDIKKYDTSPICLLNWAFISFVIIIGFFFFKKKILV